MEISPLLPASVTAAGVLLKAVATDVPALTIPSPAVAATADPEAAARSQLAKLVASEKPPPLADTLLALKAELADRPAERGAVDQLLPDDREPPTADRVRTAVRDGGNHLEAKLARGERVPPGSDLKADLLNLARTLPAAALALSAVERQQAANALAPPGGMTVYAIPFPDGPHRRTLGLGVEVEQPDADGTPSSRFRVTLHVPLSGLGETWIDAAADGPRLRAVLFVQDAAGRERVRAEADELATELRREGFAAASVEVRDAAEMTDGQRRRANAVREGLPAGGVLDVVA